MKPPSIPVALSGLLFSICLLISATTHAQPVIATATCGAGAAVTGAPLAAACRGKSSAGTRPSFQATAHKPAVAGSVRRIRNIPSECSSCPLVATCYRA